MKQGVVVLVKSLLQLRDYFLHLFGCFFRCGVLQYDSESSGKGVKIFNVTLLGMVTVNYTSVSIFLILPPAVRLTSNFGDPCHTRKSSC